MQGAQRRRRWVAQLCGRQGGEHSRWTGDDDTRCGEDESEVWEAYPSPAAAPRHLTSSSGNGNGSDGAVRGGGIVITASEATDAEGLIDMHDAPTDRSTASPAATHPVLSAGRLASRDALAVDTAAGDGVERVAGVKVFARQYRDVPLCDLQLGFPALSMRMKDFDRLKLAVLGIGGVSVGHQLYV